MIKIWAKKIKNEKIISQKVNTFDTDKISFFDLVKTVCQSLDLETPVILTKHFEDLKKFRFCTFIKDDFVEKVDFDKLLLERI